MSHIHRSNQTHSSSSHTSHIYTLRPRSLYASSSTSLRRTALRTRPYPFSEFSLLFNNASHKVPLSTALCVGSVLSMTSTLLPLFSSLMHAADRHCAPHHLLAFLAPAYGSPTLHTAFDRVLSPVHAMTSLQEYFRHVSLCRTTLL
ncbi:hypothetical protein B0H14DRAFT_3464742 [Mycena olivaceomarginata]|nr:hypothetical protein B0H14DRAFT_3464742 [Mycena olivaceomarginata]